MNVSSKEGIDAAEPFASEYELEFTGEIGKT